MRYSNEYTITDFGHVNIPSSALLNLTRELAYAVPKPNFLYRLFFGTPRNAAMEILDGYKAYVNQMAEIGWSKGGDHWQIDVLSFDEWLKVR